MTSIKKLFPSLFSLLIAISLAMPCFANDAPSKDPLSPTDFVNQTLVSGVAQTETARLALQQSTISEIKDFAQLVIDERAAATNDLTNIAKKKRLKVMSSQELLNRAQPLILKLNNNENFDSAYVENQIKARQDEIELFNKGALSKDPELAGFATENIPKLTHNLHLAETLAKDLEKR